MLMSFIPLRDIEFAFWNRPMIAVSRPAWIDRRSGLPDRRQAA
jgi:hypothetical protein